MSVLRYYQELEAVDDYHPALIKQKQCCEEDTVMRNTDVDSVSGKDKATLVNIVSRLETKKNSWVNLYEVTNG